MLEGMDPQVLDQIIREIPVGRLGQTQEIAHAVAFLAAEESGFITGSNLDINGGQYM
jgi:acetoacetyl-CoA reductase